MLIDWKIHSECETADNIIVQMSAILENMMQTFQRSSECIKNYAVV